MATLRPNRPANVHQSRELLGRSFAAREHVAPALERERVQRRRFLNRLSDTEREYQFNELVFSVGSKGSGPPIAGCGKEVCRSYTFRSATTQAAINRVASFLTPPPERDVFIEPLGQLQGLRCDVLWNVDLARPYNHGKHGRVILVVISRNVVERNGFHCVTSSKVFEV